MDQPGTSKKVLIVSARVGAGHAQAAKAVQEQLRLDAPRVRVDHLDVLELLSPMFRLYYQSGYSLSMTRFGRLYGLGFRIFNRPNRPGRSLDERLRLRSERFWLRPFIDLLEREKPDLVVSTHFLTPPAITFAANAGRFDVPQMVVVTDYDPHRWWYSQGVEKWFIPSEQDRGKLLSWGIRHDDITVTTIPVHPKWTAPMDRNAILRDWNLPADKPIVVLSGGAEFTCGPVQSIAREILKSPQPCCLVVLAGRNKQLLGQLANWPQAREGLLKPVSFTDRAQELVSVASLMVTKPGGVTTAECCAVGAPMVLLKPVPGQEEGNARYFSLHGAAIVAQGSGDVAGIVHRLLADKAKLEEMSCKAKGLHMPASKIIAGAIMQRLG
ncbi:MAG: hypothetical protein GXY38_07945 [Planctomycetes bacterium]|nr:hypothetical protein [Planctomycetota bacterium]